MSHDTNEVYFYCALSLSLSLSLSIPFPGVLLFLLNINFPLSFNTLQQTTAHKWHVHVDLPQEGVECVFAVGWHFNPFDVDLGPTYGAECDINAPLRYMTE